MHHETKRRKQTCITFLRVFSSKFEQKVVNMISKSIILNF